MLLLTDLKGNGFLPANGSPSPLFSKRAALMTFVCWAIVLDIAFGEVSERSVDVDSRAIKSLPELNEYEEGTEDIAAKDVQELPVSRPRAAIRAEVFSGVCVPARGARIVWRESNDA